MEFAVNSLRPFYWATEIGLWMQPAVFWASGSGRIVVNPDITPPRLRSSRIGGHPGESSA
jgi:hypothetical protein